MVMQVEYSLRPLDATMCSGRQIMPEYSRKIWFNVKQDALHEYLLQHFRAHDWHIKSTNKSQSYAEIIDRWAKDLDFIEVRYVLRANCSSRTFGTEVVFTVSEHEQTFSQKECELKCSALVDSLNKKIVVPRPLLMVEAKEE